MKAVHDTQCSDGACVYEVSSNYLVRIKSYGPDKQRPYLTVNCDLDVRVMKSVRDTPSSNGACVYEVLSNYVERSKTYGPAGLKDYASPIPGASTLGLRDSG
jgi:hypothetical protein